MSQFFPAWTNTLLRAGPIVLLLMVCAGIAAGMVVVRSSYATGEDHPVEQPVPFSHQHHVADVGLDCRYCHTSVEHSAFAGIPATEVCMNCHRRLWTDAAMLEPVRESWRTGEPIGWERVHDLPDFVYFNHSVHVAKGIGCVACHGRIDRMPLTWRENSLQMRWCLECHRNPTVHLRPHEVITRMESLEELAGDPALEKALARLFPDREPSSVKPDAIRERLAEMNDVQSLTDCYTCHR
jgi:hypothetical protein